MSPEDLRMMACKCGADVQNIEASDIFKATTIECDVCGRIVGGLNMDEAIEMWDAAMMSGAKTHSRARDGKDRSKR
jgi:hypothetical protein